MFPSPGDTVLQARRCLEEQLRVATDEGRPPGHGRLEPLRGAVVQRQHVVLDGLNQPQPLQLCQHLGVVGGEVVGLAVVARAVVELPSSSNAGSPPPTITQGVLCLVTALQPLW